MQQPAAGACLLRAAAPATTGPAANCRLQCWIGWSRLQQALEDFKGQAAFDVRWRTFLLDPEFPETGGSKRWVGWRCI